MRSATRWFDTWVQQGPFTPADLGRYRIVYCLLLVVLAPTITWLGPYPAAFYNPPPGPFQALSAFPAPWILVVIQILVYVFLAATLLGFHTTVSSVGLFVSLVTAYGLTYSVGKIDHGMVMVVVPLVLAFARWGDAVSIDALRARRHDGRPIPTPELGSEGQPQWPLRLFGLIIGLAFVTAAVPKVLGGWLSLSSQASYGYEVRSHFASNRHSVLSDWLVNLRVPAVWEFMDWTTVLLEGLVVLCLISWRSWRIGLAVLVLFHLGIGLSLGIWFVGNVISYAAFVSWSRVPLPRITLSPTTTRRVIALAPLAVAAVAGLTWASISLRGNVNDAVDAAVVITATVVAIGYLGVNARALLVHLRARRVQHAPTR